MVCLPSVDTTCESTESVHAAILRLVERQLVSAQSSFAEVVAYSRAVRVGDHVFVAGTAPVMPDREAPPDDPYAQAQRCLEIIVEALEEAGAKAEHVVRTRIYLTRANDIDEVGRAH